MQVTRVPFHHGQHRQWTFFSLNAGPHAAFAFVNPSRNTQYACWIWEASAKKKKRGERNAWVCQPARAAHFRSKESSNAPSYKNSANAQNTPS
jgi:hypothetical protein